MNLRILLHFQSLCRNRLIVPGLIVFALLAALIVIARGCGNVTLKAEDAEHPVVQGQPSGRIHGLPLNLTRFGFEPSKITVPAGRCLLAVRNQSGLESVELQLSREVGERLVSERHPKGKRYWQREVVLTPGNYILTEANHPQWIMRITVGPPGQ